MFCLAFKLQVWEPLFASMPSCVQECCDYISVLTGAKLEIATTVIDLQSFF